MYKIVSQGKVPIESTGVLMKLFNSLGVKCSNGLYKMLAERVNNVNE